MDTTGLRAAYDKLFDIAARPDLGEAEDGGWNADQILAHLLSVDAAIAAVALGVVSGSRPTFDNRVSLDPWNLERIIAEHAGRQDLTAHLRSQVTVLCGIADRLGEQTAAVLVPSLLLSGDALVLDQPVPLAALIDGLAEDHVPRHTRQLLDLRVAAPGRV
ncbi:hypothetical protein ABT040_24400 [Streptomyces sp. NPDC002688]|uniref:hypothetical protein n=1 Tax=Streptomyces sp. NPDC002688 TaxID=3154423 RepID=UPI00332FA188